MITPESLLPELERAIQREVARAIDAAVDEATDKVRGAIQERLGPIACSLLTNYRVDRHGQQLTITVNIGEARP